MALQNGREENGEWNTLRLTLPRDGSNFNQFTQDACLVKVTKDNFYILGGRKSSYEPATSNVFMINMKEQNVEEVGSLLHPRAQHACAIIAGEPSEDLTMTSRLILVTGGTTANDEIFDVTLRSSRRVDHSMVVPRKNHKMVNIGHKIFALGGHRLTNDASLAEVEVFDPNSESWILHTSTLLTQSTDSLAVTQLPISAVSCNQGCQCGVKAAGRIVGGEEAQV